MPPPSNLYLFGYNSLQAFGWAIAVFRILTNFISTGFLYGGYASAGDLICLLQSVAFLEVIHGAIGLVPSGVVLPLMQWGGRTHFLLAIVRQIDEVRSFTSLNPTSFGRGTRVTGSVYYLSCMELKRALEVMIDPIVKRLDLIIDRIQKFEEARNTNDTLVATKDEHLDDAAKVETMVTLDVKLVSSVVPAKHHELVCHMSSPKPNRGAP
ncbi:hypothetical protein F8388_005652 [Cannabis sativa]|uniref:Very-long-chain (3R)-3-hydroxyacyl-CoA dehydratase n=1 Tax=Cannabis sativa TaxID=3483 RepID=A0A7J6EUB9_CANSA|nr:hypothetical protein F8388_005652 [Cannabis sativa]